MRYYAEKQWLILNFKRIATTESTDIWRNDYVSIETLDYNTYSWQYNFYLWPLPFELHYFNGTAYRLIFRIWNDWAALHCASKYENTWINNSNLWTYGLVYVR